MNLSTNKIGYIHRALVPLAGKFFLLLVVMSAVFQQVAAHELQAGQLKILHPYVAPTPPGAKVAVGYMVISNQGDQQDRLLGGSASFAKGIEVHRSVIENDVAKMRQLKEGLVLPAGDTTMLVPGKTHLMFVGLSQQLLKDKRYSVTLLFEKAGEVNMEFAVENIDGQEAMDHSKM